MRPGGRHAPRLACSVKMSVVARGQKAATVGDMVRTLAVIVVPVLIIAALFTQLPDDHPVQAVDWQRAVAGARAKGEFAVMAPTGLPAGWRATRADWTPVGGSGPNGDPSPRNLWRLDFLDPEDRYFGLYQGDAGPDDLVDSASRGGVPDGESQVAGQPWERLLSPDGRTRSLVRRGGDSVAVVVADLDYEALEAYAATLSTS